MSFVVDLASGFTFQRISSPIHRLDPRSKLAIAISLSIVSLLFRRALPLLVLFLCIVPFVFIARVQSRWLRSLRWLGIFAFVIFAVDFYFYRDLDFSLAMATRFLALTTAFSIFFLTTLPDELGLMLEKLHVPFDISFAFVGAVRFVPVMANEAIQVLDSHRARGFRIRGGPIRRLKQYVPILVTIIISAIKRSNELAESLESKAFGAKKARVDLYELKMRAVDYLCLLLAIAIVAVPIYLGLGGI